MSTTAIEEEVRAEPLEHHRERIVRGQYLVAGFTFKGRPVLDVVIGTCKFFLEGKKQDYGFVTVDEEDIFIHRSRGVQFACNGGSSVVFAAAERTPKKGDRIVLSGLSQSRRGLRADHWMLVDYELMSEVLCEIECRPLLRVVERRGRRKVSKLFHPNTASSVVLWTGVDQRALRKQFPARTFPLIDRPTYLFAIEEFDGNEWHPVRRDPRFL